MTNRKRRPGYRRRSESAQAHEGAQYHRRHIERSAPRHSPSIDGASIDWIVTPAEYRKRRTLTTKVPHQQ
jgi:hypothetical protein